MQIQLSETTTKYHGQKVKTAAVNIPGKGRIELALSDTARCARMPEAARNTVVNICGGEDVFDSEEDIAANAQLLQAHCRKLLGISDDKPAGARR
jgi:hypothetical protein